MTDAKTASPRPSFSADPESPTRGQGWGLWIVLLVCGAFVAFWWNRVFPPTDGHDLFFHFAYRQGFLPHRDYFEVTPPGYFLWSVWIHEWFGESHRSYAIVNLMLRLAAVGCLYSIAARWTTPLYAGVAVVTAFIASSADIADTAAFYNHTLISFAVLGTFFAVRVIENVDASPILGGFLAGLFWTCGFTIKQTAGLIPAVGGAALCLAVIRLHGWRRCFQTVIGLAVGIAAPLVTIGLWLSNNGLLEEFIEQAFRRGPASKGGLLGALSRPFIDTWRIGTAFWSLMFAIAFSANFALAVGLARDRKSEILATLVFAIVGGIYWFLMPTSSRIPLLALGYVSLIGCTAVAIVALVRFLRDPANVAAALLGLCAAISAACSFLLSMSWVIWEPMIFPGLVILLTGALRPHRPPIHGVRHLLLILCGIVVVLSGWRKFDMPYTWGFWTEPTLAAERVPSKSSLLRGLHFSRPAAEFLDGTTEIIQTRSEPGDRVFVFPYFSVLYALSDRLPSVYARQHWFDICPDEVAEADAKRLLESPPAVIVAMEFPKEIIAREEFNFREGRRSGQRAIIAAIGKLAETYELAATFPAPGSRYPIKVWVRPK